MGFQTDIGAFVHVAGAMAGQNAVQAGATGNQTALTGIQIDQRSLPRKFHSAKIAVPVSYQLDTGRSLTVKVDMQERSATSGAGSTWANFGTTGSKVTVVNNTTATSTGVTVATASIAGLKTAKRYLRIRVSPSTKYIDTTATAAGTINTFRIGGGAVVFGGADELPASG